MGGEYLCEECQMGIFHAFGQVPVGDLVAGDEIADALDELRVALGAPVLVGPTPWEAAGARNATQPPGRSPPRG
jgi:hypothetical protein